MSSVIDASVAAKWLLRDERSKAADDVLTTVGGEGAVVPAIFLFEIENILIVAERRKRIDGLEVEEAISLLRTLDLQIEPYSPAFLGRHVDIARRYALTAYDAAYVMLAAQLRVPLYTADARLAAAARKEKIATVLVA